MPFITFEKPNIWDEACYEVRTGSPEIPLPPGGLRYNSAIHSPVFAGYSFQQVKVSDSSLVKDFDAACAHPSTLGYSMTVLTKDDPKDTTNQQKGKEKAISPLECSAVTYLVNFLFPTVTTALETMLVQAKTEKCFERKRTKFNACDFLTEYLYKHNPIISEEERERRSSVPLFEIPFAKDWLQEHPRKPLPLSLIWTEEQAVVVLQSAWRGYLLRRQPEVQELRKWQREWREENRRVLDGEIDRMFSRAHSRASSGQSPRSRPSSKRISPSQRQTRSGKRLTAHSGNSSASGPHSDPLTNNGQLLQNGQGVVPQSPL